MNSAKSRYVELLNLTQLYLLQEHALTDRIYDSFDTFDYFRRTVQQQPVKSEPAPVKVVQALPPLPPAPPILPPEPILVAPPVKVSPPVETIPKPEEKSLPKTYGTIAIESQPPSKPIDFSDLRKIMGEKFPHIPLIDNIPDDAVAKRAISSGKQPLTLPQVALLAFDEIPAHREFLTNVAKAIEGIGATAQVHSASTLENDFGWDVVIRSGVRLVIASSSGLYASPGLQKLHREVQKQGRHYLGDCPLLLMSDIGFYLQEPSLKHSLWATIKEHVKSFVRTP